MSYFFGYSDDTYGCRLAVPKFANRSDLSRDLRLYRIHTDGTAWHFTLAETKENADFFIVEGSQFEHALFALAQPAEVARAQTSMRNALGPLNHCTERSPAFRANFRVTNQHGAFSSYQSEYPFRMLPSSGGKRSIVSTSSTLSNTAGKNYILFATFSSDPSIREEPVYFVDDHTRAIIASASITTNTVSKVAIPDEALGNPHCSFFSPGALGIPVYMADTNTHLSFEHTHPPHEYVLDGERFRIVGQLKKDIYEIVSEATRSGQTRACG